MNSKNREQVSLDIFSKKPNDDEILEAFEKQARGRPVREKFQPQIALPSYDEDKDNSIDWDEFDRNHLMYPCYEATKIPIGEARNQHCQSCPKCIEMKKKMDEIFLKDNKWLDGTYRSNEGIYHKKEEPEWII